MKRVAIGILVVGLVGAGVLYGKEMLVKPQTVVQGASVPLILMRELEAGKVKEGEEVLFIVAQDVKAQDGGIAIAKGAAVKGVVAQSRGENMLSGITNRPARLAVKFEEVKAVDGTVIPLSATLEGGDEAMHSFTRANTGKQDVVEKLTKLSADADVKATLDQIKDSFAEGKAPDFSDPKTKEALAKISKELDLKALGKAIAEDRAGEVADALKSTRDVGSAARALTGGSLTLAAVLELADVMGNVGSKFSRVLGGRSIRAYPGTEATAYVAQTAQVRTK